MGRTKLPKTNEEEAKEEEEEVVQEEEAPAEAEEEPEGAEAAAEAAGEAPVVQVDEEAVQNVVIQVVDAAVTTTTTTTTSPRPPILGVTSPSLHKRKRLCRYPGCSKVIKSQGHCQRHGARAKRCKVEGCEKQAQGTHDGMCKRHWKQVHFPSAPPKPEQVPPPPQGESIYDTILPASVSYRPLSNTVLKAISDVEKQEGKQVDDKDEVAPMPLVTFLKEGQELDAGWHRNAERRARGVFPVAALSSQLEPWERQLALLEIFLLSGGTPQANFQDLAHAWGREKGFHQLLANSVCERRGEVERKKRSDAGKTMTPAERQAFREKLKKARLSSGSSTPNNEAAAAAAAAAAADASATGEAQEEEKQQEEEKEETTEGAETTTEELKPASVEEMEVEAETAETVSV